ncbi:MAG TPA: DinB family protein [Symbiobacteriaceae bacterium]|nr:DinB family protein [Symbiobacteriaceae bacterium]
MLAFDLYRHWETDVRPFTVTALRRLSPEQLHWRPDGGRSAWDLALEAVQTEWRWIYRDALQKVDSSARFDSAEFESLDALLLFWQRVHRATLEWLQDSPVTELARKYRMPDVGAPLATMNWILFNVLTQEARMQGELFSLMRQQGLTPPKI